MVADSVYASLFKEKYSEDAQQIPTGSLAQAMTAQSSLPVFAFTQRLRTGTSISQSCSLSISWHCCFQAILRISYYFLGETTAQYLVL